MKSIVWIVPEKQGGIADYSAELFTELQRGAGNGYSLSLVSGDASSSRHFEQSILSKIKEAPDLIHIQHEYGLFGSKVPGRYSFPRIVALIHERFPRARLMGTAHTVIDQSFRYPVTGRHRMLKRIANLTAVPLLRSHWNRGTWPLFDAVIVHSDLQRQIVMKTGVSRVETIPHFAPAASAAFSASAPVPTVVVFGYFSPEKGQDVAIQAFTLAAKKIKGLQLILAGGARRKADESYLRYCRQLLSRLAISDRVKITGYVEAAEVDRIFRSATLVLAPFRASSGSGTLAQALARGMPILASDLPLNREIDSRIKGSLQLFRAGNAEDCSNAIVRMIGDPPALKRAAERALQYAAKYSLAQTAASHLLFYSTL